MEFDKEAMNQAALKASLELPEILEKGYAIDVAVWFKKWYMTAGYKRLARVLMKGVK